MSTEAKSNHLEIIKKSLVEIRGLKNRIEELESGLNAPVAIIGIACDFPGGVGNAEEYWNLLCSDATGIVEPPENIWGMTARGYDYSDRIYRGGYLRRSLAEFDPLAFGIAPKEAKYLDPQHRLFLENTWKALADAGIPIDSLDGSETGVFCGITGSDYLNLMLRDLDPKNYSMYLTTGNCSNFATGRISYILGLKGPSMAIDTACSSSLVAVHLACENIRRGTCNVAIAGGVNAILAPNVSESLIQGSMISATAKCSPYDNSANGYVRGEGCGVVILKSLKDALANDDRIYGVIRGSVMNHDGKKSGLTVPNSHSQSEMIASALRIAGVQPEEIDYVEGHGTGTSLGDPIELEALKRSFRKKGSTKKKPLLVGSAKAKLGHLEAASGIAALIKASLMLTHSTIPRHMENFEGNGNFDWDGSIEIPKTNIALDESSPVRIAINSLGASGTNAHLILESAPNSHRRAIDQKSTTVPFKRAFCWYRNDPRTIRDTKPVSRASENPYKKYELVEGKYVFPLSIDSVPHIREHRIFGKVVLTGSIYFDLALKIAQEHFPSESIRNYSLHNVNLSNPIIFDEKTKGIQVLLEKPRRGEPWLCRINLLPMNATLEKGAFRYASIDVALIDAPSPDDGRIEPEKIKTSFQESYSGEEFYGKFWGHTFTIGPKFRLFQNIWRDDGNRLLGYAKLDAFKSETSDYGIDSDSFLAYLSSLLFKGVLPKQVLDAATTEGKAVVGTGYDYCHHYGKLSDHENLYCLAVLTKRNDEIRQYHGDCTIYSQTGEPLCKMGNISFSVIGDGNFRSEGEQIAHPEIAEAPRRVPVGHAVLGNRHEKMVAWTYESPLEYDTYPIIGDHRTFDYSLFPGLGYIHLAAMAVREIRPGFVFNRVYDLRITQPILLRKGEECIVRTSVEKLSDNEFDYSVLGCSAKSDIVNREWGFSSGASLARESDAPTESGSFDPDELNSYPETYGRADFYRKFWGNEFVLGDSYHFIEKVWRKPYSAVCLMGAQSDLTAATGITGISPAFLQVYMSLPLSLACVPDDILEKVNSDKGTCIAATADKFAIYNDNENRPFTRLWAVAELSERENITEKWVSDFRYYDDSGKLVAEVTGVVFRIMKREAVELLRESLIQDEKESDKPTDIDLEGFLRKELMYLTEMDDAALTQCRTLGQILDSIMILKLKNGLEEAFSVFVPFSELLEATSFSGLLKTVERKMNAVPV